MGNFRLLSNKVQLVNKEGKMTKYPYSTTHYHCGCHIVEVKPNDRDLAESIFCEDKNSYTGIRTCLYTPVLIKQRMEGRRKNELQRDFDRGSSRTV